jgi:DNA polymerase (family 10)
MTKPSNDKIADVLEQIADLLEAQDGNVHRIRAYRNGARTARNSSESLAKIARDRGVKGLQELPNIGEGLGRIIQRYVETGRSRMLERLQGQISPEDIFTQVPGIGPELARRIADELDVHSLAELEQAAHEGRLEQVKGFGPKRVESVRLSLAGMLSRSAQRRARERSRPDEGSEREPCVAILLDVDREYQSRARAGELRKIAPKRFNPDNEAWLPILHTERGNWSFTALYSNTARAHELNKTDDWVVIYFDQDGKEDQVTVVTGTQGDLKGKRVVRGREQVHRLLSGNRRQWLARGSPWITHKT